jgi:hypothetical protein
MNKFGCATKARGGQNLNQADSESSLRGVVPIAALVVVGAWLAFLSWLTFNTSASEVVWARLFSVLGSLEAVAFDAAGALFGTTVQKQRVEDARDRAEKAEGRASGAEKTAAEYVQNAANGRALATAVKARRGIRAGTPGLEQVTGADLPKEVNDDLVSLAETLFPS